MSEQCFRTRGRTIRQAQVAGERDAKLSLRHGTTEGNDLRQEVRAGLDNGDFALSYVWIKFWAYGGSASRTDMESFVYGMQEPSKTDVRILGDVIKEMRTK